MLIAITREVSPAIGNCELTHLKRVTIDVGIAQAQHRQYEDCLAALGCEIHRLPVEPDLPDSVFVEDCAVVLDELAIITRPGADSRRPETGSIARALEPYRKLCIVRGRLRQWGKLETIDRQPMRRLRIEPSHQRTRQRLDAPDHGGSSGKTWRPSGPSGNGLTHLTAASGNSP